MMIMKLVLKLLVVAMLASHVESLRALNAAIASDHDDGCHTPPGQPEAEMPTRNHGQTPVSQKVAAALHMPGQQIPQRTAIDAMADRWAAGDGRTQMRGDS